jgi:hypothetical protein
MPQLKEHTDASAKGAHSCIRSRSAQRRQLESHTAASARGAHSGISSRSTQLEEHRNKDPKHRRLCQLARTVMGDSSLEDQLTGTKTRRAPRTAPTPLPQ